ncbi:major facilitator superfamily domain-containing protein 6-A-like isoform X2 [Adelges cooleyi]|uniref:major facilitator superfamily domain-containing protein 6-A-like isoform X2 n=1 Tax=Adelges cooleyi TaxID=133065 RepID=UPI00217FCFBC|nr:major facilitator superfamily domain-containing protein 6-A-like isoform X2 [Adelges cooleyi]
MKMMWQRNINKNLLFMKMNYFFAYGAYAPIVPFISTIGKQRGYSAFVMGIALTALQIPSLIVRPTLGSITDVYKCRRFMFLAGEVLFALVVIGLVFIPGATASEMIDDKIVFETMLFWAFFCIIFLLCLGAVIRSIMEDTICVSLLGDNVNNYGRQKVWGSIGYGVVSIISGASVDWFSKGKDYKDYRPGYVISFFFSIMDIYVSTGIKVVQVKKNKTIGGDLKNVATDFRVIIFFISIICFGFLMAFIQNFLFWYLEDITNLYHPEIKPWIKTVQGLFLITQYFLSEVPLYFLSSFIIKRIGHMNVFSLAFLALSIRFMLYSLIKNPIIALSVEILHGFTNALTESAAVAYAAKLSPVGAEGTMQGLIGMALLGIESRVHHYF